MFTEESDEVCLLLRQYLSNRETYLISDKGALFECHLFLFKNLCGQILILTVEFDRFHFISFHYQFKLYLQVKQRKNNTIRLSSGHLEQTQKSYLAKCNFLNYMPRRYYMPHANTDTNTNFNYMK